MVVRFLFLVNLIFLYVFVNQFPLNAACETTEQGNSDKKQALSSGKFVSCGHKVVGQGQDSWIAEFGIPQKPIKENDPDSGLTPIEPTEYNNPNVLNFLGNSNVKFYFYKFLNNADITVTDNSQLDLQLYNTIADIKFTLSDENSNISYRGGTKGKVSVYLNTTCNNSDCFRTNSNIDYLNFQGEITHKPDGTFNTISSGGIFTVGTKDNNSQEESSDIVVNYITGNGSIELTPKSNLTIKNYKIADTCDVSNPNCFVQRIRGGYESKVILDTEVFIRSLEVPNAILNHYSKILNISSDNNGKYIFNANSDIQAISIMHNMLLNNNAHVIVQEVDSIEEANVSRGSILELLGESNLTYKNNLNKVQGEGTVWIHPAKWQSGNSSDFKVNDVNLNNLIFDDGAILIENSNPTYTNTQIDSKGNTLSSDTLVRHIRNITRSNNNAIGGELTVRGTVSLDNIDYLKKLVICDTASNSNICSKNANLTIKKVNKLNEFEINNGKLYLEITNSNNRDTSNTPALNITDTALFKGGEFIGVIKDTTTIKNRNTYWVINSPKLNITSKDIFKTSLPDWYSYKYYQDNTKIMLDVERLANYRDIVAQSSFKENSSVLKLAEYFDSLINSNNPLDVSAKTLTYLDLLSENSHDILASNIQSLIPLSKNTYIKATHSNMKEALDISKSKGVTDTVPFGIWDKRHEVQTPKDNFWAVYSISDDQYDNKDSHKNNLIQFGYNFYNWVSPNNREGQTFNLVGGISKGNMNNYNYDSNVSSFNIGGILDFRDENDIFKFSLFYGLTSFNTQRDYFVSACTSCLSDYPELKGLRLGSNLDTHEILLDAQYSHEIFVEYLKSFAGWSNVILTPRIYFTPSLLIGNKYTEDGEISSIHVGYYTAPILESGTGFDLSKGFNFSRNTNIRLFFTADGLYRYYKIPTTSIGFSEVSSTISLGSEGSVSSFVINSSIGAAFNYRSSQLSSFYKREIAKDYYQNIFIMTYKYLF